jgi:hypothetical protein
MAKRKPKHITARSISLNDAKGKTRIYMDAGNGDGFAAISLFGNGGLSIHLSTQPNGSAVISLEGKKCVASLGMNTNEDAGLSIRDRQGLLGTMLGSMFDSGEHHLTIFKNGQIYWSTRKSSVKKIKKLKK